MSIPSAFSAEEIADRNAHALARAAGEAARPNTTAARPSLRFNHVLGYGQSLSSGWEGWPALSATQPLDNLMIGDSVRPRHEAGPHWHPVGEPAFRPLRATNQARLPGQHVPCELLDDAAVAALPPGTAALGETVLEAAVNFFRALQLRAAAMPADPAHVLVASSCGVSGRTVSELLPDAEPALFNRLRDCIAAGRTLAAPNSYGVLALLYLQGEQDYAVATPPATYLAALRRLYLDVLALIEGQSRPPAMFTYQTSGGYTRDAGLLAVGMAQLQAALRYPDWYLVAPSYPVTNKMGGHLDANGHRWLGMQFGKVMHRVLTLGQTWRPLHPTGILRRGNTLLLEFHVPAPPLCFDRPFLLSRRFDVQDHGFRVTDASGAVPLASVMLAGAAAVQLILARQIQGPALCWYADRTAHHGHGGLRDSDGTVASACYEYTPNRGHDPAANIPDLVGKPYPLQNWCVAFVLPVPADHMPMSAA